MAMLQDFLHKLKLPEPQQYSDDLKNSNHILQVSKSESSAGVYADGAYIYFEAPMGTIDFAMKRYVAAGQNWTDYIQGDPNDYDYYLINAAQVPQVMFMLSGAMVRC